MDAALEFHDSEVARVHAEGTTLRIAFSAAHVRRSAGTPGTPGTPGTDAGRGYLQGVSIALAQAIWTGDLGSCAGRISYAHVRVAGIDVGLLPIPGALAAPVVLLIQFANGAELRAEAASLQVAAGDDARFVEDFSC